MCDAYRGKGKGAGLCWEGGCCLQIRRDLMIARVHFLIYGAVGRPSTEGIHAVRGGTGA